jgi:hypothetical protein
MSVKLLVGSLFILLPLSAGAASTPYQMGVALESRVQHDVNPDDAHLQNLPQLWARYNWERWAAQLEYTQEDHSSGSGSLRIVTVSRVATLWGRYKYIEFTEWNPFVGVGGGYYFDQTESTFESSERRISGRRGLLGASTGIGTPLLWQHFDVEAEARVETLEQSADPLFSFLVRLGVRI